jgi:hypothetical protein
MRKSKTFAKKITAWELMIGNIKPHLPEMPYLQEIVTALDMLIAEAKDVDSEQESARGQWEGLVHRRQGVEKAGEALRRRAAAHLRGRFGFTSDALLRFGVRPRQTGPRGPRQAGAPVADPQP